MEQNIASLEALLRSFEGSSGGGGGGGGLRSAAADELRRMGPGAHRVVGANELDAIEEMMVLEVMRQSLMEVAGDSSAAVGDATASGSSSVAIGLNGHGSGGLSSSSIVPTLPQAAMPPRSSPQASSGTVGPIGPSYWRGSGNSSDSSSSSSSSSSNGGDGSKDSEDDVSEGGGSLDWVLRGPGVSPVRAPSDTVQPLPMAAALAPGPPLSARRSLSGGNRVVAEPQDITPEDEEEMILLALKLSMDPTFAHAQSEPTPAPVHRTALAASAPVGSSSSNGGGATGPAASAVVFSPILNPSGGALLSAAAASISPFNLSQDGSAASFDATLSDSDVADALTWPPAPAHDSSKQ